MKRGIFFLLMAFVGLSELSYATITLTNVSDPSIGLVLSGASGRQFILGTNSGVSGTDASDYISGAAAGNITAADSTAPLSITIAAINISTSGGLTANQVLCSYDNGTETRCDNGGYSVTSISSATLLIGIDVSTSQAHSGGASASVNFDIEITYV